MTKSKNMKSALISSILALLLCFSMLLGTTFAWFTDSVTSSGNIIKAGNLDVSMDWAEGTADPQNTEWTDASLGAIFKNDLWEPGYIEVRHIKIENKGSLALKYRINIAANGDVSELADVIDVYYIDPAQQIENRDNLSQMIPMGTLSAMLDNMSGDSSTATGNLLAGEAHTVTIALKMQETAGNKYQGLSIGTDFSIKLSATQYNYENDSFGSDYDEGLDPEATYVSGAQSLKDAMLIRDAYIVLNEDIIVDASTPLQWGAYMFVANGREVTIDLNGNDIIVEDDALLKTHAVFTTANGGTLNIVGDGTVTVKNGKSGIFHAMNANDQINVYGGTYVSNSDNGSDSLAILYTNSGNIDVYGGMFHPLDGVECANAEDKQGNRLSIVFHEGAILKHTKYYAGYDATRIQLAEGCKLDEVVIDGQTWYMVVSEDTDVVGSASEFYASTLNGGSVYLNTDLNTSDSDKHYNGNREYAIRDGIEYTLELNGHTVNHDGTYQDGKNTGYTYLYTTAYNGKLTINGEGTINSANSEGCACILYAQGPSEAVINGGNFNVNRGVAVWAGNNSKVTINGGSFISTGATDEELIYSSGGVIDIYGGFFHNTGWENRPVNVANANRGTGFINIYGGTFVNFDPSTGGDDPANIRVAEGCKVVPETQANGDVWYTVVAK